MSKSALLNLLPDERRKVIRHTEDGKTYMETRQDVSQIIRNAAILSEQKPGKDFTRVAVIPKTVLDQALIDGWFHDEAAWKKWANDPANRCYRTTEGTI